LPAYQGADNEHRLQASGIAHLAAEKQAVLRGHQRELVACLEGLIAAISPASVRSDKPRLRAVTMSVFGMPNWFYMWNGDAGEAPRRDYAQLVCDLCLHGFSGLSCAPE